MQVVRGILRISIATVDIAAVTSKLITLATARQTDRQQRGAGRGGSGRLGVAGAAVVAKLHSIKATQHAHNK